MLVALGILILRKTQPDQPRPFRTPWVPLVPMLAILSCGYLMVAVAVGDVDPLHRLARGGMVFYYLYGYGHSRLGQRQQQRHRADKPAVTEVAVTGAALGGLIGRPVAPASSLHGPLFTGLRLAAAS